MVAVVEEGEQERKREGIFDKAIGAGWVCGSEAVCGFERANIP